MLIRVPDVFWMLHLALGSDTSRVCFSSEVSSTSLRASRDRDLLSTLTSGTTDGPRVLQLPCSGALCRPGIQGRFTPRVL